MSVNSGSEFLLRIIEMNKRNSSRTDTFDECESISPGGISLVHLNDSEKEFGSRVDRHAPLGMGYIWGKGQFSGLKTLIERCREKNIDMVSETSDPESDHA